jgi:hypothetical protein
VMSFEDGTAEAGSTNFAPGHLQSPEYG